MYKIVSKKILNSALELMEIHAPFVARKCEAGQFIIIRVDEDGERIPLTIADSTEKMRQLQSSIRRLVILQICYRRSRREIT